MIPDTLQHPLSDAPSPFVSLVANHHGVSCIPPKRYVEVLTRSVSQCTLIWK